MSLYYCWLKTTFSFLKQRLHSKTDTSNVNQMLNSDKYIFFKCAQLCLWAYASFWELSHPPVRKLKHVNSVHRCNTAGCTLSWLSFRRSESMTAVVPMTVRRRRCSERLSDSTRLAPWKETDRKSLKHYQLISLTLSCWRLILTFIFY